MGHIVSTLYLGTVIDYLDQEALVSQDKVFASFDTVQNHFGKQLWTLSESQAMRIAFCQDVHRKELRESDNVSVYAREVLDFERGNNLVVEEETLPNSRCIFFFLALKRFILINASHLSLVTSWLDLCVGKISFQLLPDRSEVLHKGLFSKVSGPSK